MAARLEADFPDYYPVSVMAEGAIALRDAARKDKSLWPEAVAASDKVAAYTVPKLRSIEVTGEGGGAILIQSVAAADDDL